MISQWDLNNRAETENKINAETPITWSEYNEIKHHPAGIQRQGHLLKRLDLATVPADIRGLVEISVKRARGERV